MSGTTIDPVRVLQSSARALVIVLVIGVAPAHAYLDPGNGSMLLQLFLGGAAGAAVMARLAWQKLVGAVRPAKAAESPDLPGSGASDQRDAREPGEA